MRSLGKTLLLVAVAALLAAAPTSESAMAPPHGLQVFVNGKRVPITPILGGSDNYAQLHAKSMFVEARWTGEASPHGGYFVRIATDEPIERIYASCFHGTSCQIPKPVPLGIDVETSWYVEFVTSKGHRVVAAYKYCLVRYT